MDRIRANILDETITRSIIFLRGLEMMVPSAMMLMMRTTVSTMMMMVPTSTSPTRNVDTDVDASVTWKKENIKEGLF